MFTINNKNVEDILKEHDIIEKFQDLQNALYQLFYTTLRIEKNMETYRTNYKAQRKRHAP